MRYVLVNGGCHGAWCWDLLIPELANLGHDAVAVELPGHGARSAESATLAGYRDAVAAELHGNDVLVGHSLGCGVAATAADACPDLVRHICFLSGPVPVEGRPLLYQSTTRSVGGSTEAESERESLAQRNMILSRDGSAFTFDRAGAYETFFHDCPDDVVDWAVERLTPQQLTPTRETVSIPRFWDAELSRSYIRCLQDRAWHRRVCDLQSRRLGVEPLTIDSSHSPFLSRPAELAALLVCAVDTVSFGPLVRGELPGRP
jgi:pimeloyl-ACP methyl ester carboxylesterase